MPRGLALMTAWHDVSPTEELTTPHHDLYVAHANINQTLWAAGKKPGSITLLNMTTSLVSDFGSAWYVGVEAETVEDDFWHKVGTPGPATRLEHSTPPAGDIWFVKPSASLGSRLAAFAVANIDPAFQGVYSDETQGNIPNFYWTAWKTAVDGPLEAERAAYEILWDDMQEAWLSGLKNAFGNQKAVVANTAGATYGNADVPVHLDGITLEDIGVDFTEAEALQIFQTQAHLWSNSPNRYGNFPLNVAWAYDLQRSGLVMRGFP